MEAFGRPLAGRVLKFDGAFAPKVLRFDGPAGRGLWYRRWSRCAARVQRVQKVQRVQRVQRVWYRLTAMSMYASFGGSAARGSENRTTGPVARWKCTPIPACGGTST